MRRHQPPDTYQRSNLVDQRYHQHEEHGQARELNTRRHPADYVHGRLAPQADANKPAKKRDEVYIQGSHHAPTPLDQTACHQEPQAVRLPGWNPI